MPTLPSSSSGITFRCRVYFSSLEAHCATLRTDTVRRDIAASTVCNVKFDDTGWQQSTLPVAQGVLALSSAVNVSLTVYASSLCATKQPISQISKDVFNLARHLKLTQSLYIGLHRVTNQLRRTRSHSNGVGHQLSARLYYVPSNPTLRPVV